MSLSRWVTKKQIAEMMGVSISKLKRLINSDPDFPKIWRNGRKSVRFKKEDIKEYIKKQSDNEDYYY